MPLVLAKPRMRPSHKVSLKASIYRSPLSQVNKSKTAFPSARYRREKLLDQAKRTTSRAIPKGEACRGEESQGGGVVLLWTCAAHYLDARSADIQWSPEFRARGCLIVIETSDFG